MTDTMQDLLAEWAEKEPTYTAKQWGAWRKTEITSQLDRDRIQGAVQRAIDQRGWYWALKNNGRSAYVTDGYDLRQESHSTSNPAHNLLSAYMQALEVAEDER